MFQQVKQVGPYEIFRNGHYGRQEKQAESGQQELPGRYAPVFPVFIYDEYENTDAKQEHNDFTLMNHSRLLNFRSAIRFDSDLSLPINRR